MGGVERPDLALNAPLTLSWIKDHFDNVTKTHVRALMVPRISASRSPKLWLAMPAWMAFRLRGRGSSLGGLAANPP